MNGYDEATGEWCYEEWCYKTEEEYLEVACKEEPELEGCVANDEEV